MKDSKLLIHIRARYWKLPNNKFIVSYCFIVAFTVKEIYQKLFSKQHRQLWFSSAVITTRNQVMILLRMSYSVIKDRSRLSLLLTL